MTVAAGANMSKTFMAFESESRQNPEGSSSLREEKEKK